MFLSNLTYSQFYALKMQNCTFLVQLCVTEICLNMQNIDFSRELKRIPRPALYILFNLTLVMAGGSDGPLHISIRHALTKQKSSYSLYEFGKDFSRKKVEK